MINKYNELQRLKHKLALNSAQSWGRQIGKSTYFDISTRYYMMTTPWAIIKSWHTRRGIQRHRLSVNYKVLIWLEENYPQFGESNPLWWRFEDKVNVTDEMLTIIQLTWAKNE